jgi:hypothetical protein
MAIVDLDFEAWREKYAQQLSPIYANIRGIWDVARSAFIAGKTAGRSLQREAAGDWEVWKEAVVEACMRVESGYVASDPRATLHAIEEWWYQLGVEQTANGFLVEKANAPRPTGTEEVACVSSDEYPREVVTYAQVQQLRSTLLEVTRERNALLAATPASAEPGSRLLSDLECAAEVLEERAAYECAEAVRQAIAALSVTDARGGGEAVACTTRLAQLELDIDSLIGAVAVDGSCAGSVAATIKRRIADARREEALRREESHPTPAALDAEKKDDG